MNTDATIRAVLGSGAASYRPLALGHTLIHVPDVELTVVLQPNGLLDFSHCHRMSRGAARRCIRRMNISGKDRNLYLGLVNEKEVAE